MRNNAYLAPDNTPHLSEEFKKLTGGSIGKRRRQLNTEHKLEWGVYDVCNIHQTDFT